MILTSSVFGLGFFAFLPVPVLLLSLCFSFRLAFFLVEPVRSTYCTMETHEEGGSASAHGGRESEAQSPPVPHRPRLVDVDRMPYTTDHQAERVSRQEPHEDDVDRATCTTRPHVDPGLGPLGES